MVKLMWSIHSEMVKTVDPATYGRPTKGWSWLRMATAQAKLSARYRRQMGR